MEARFSSIVRSTFTQMNFSTSKTDHNTLTDETFAARYTKYRDIRSMENLPLAIRITVLRSPCHAETRLRLLSLSDKELDVKTSHRGPESAVGPLTASVQPEKRRYNRDCPTKDVANRTVTKMVTKKASAENLLRTVTRLSYGTLISTPAPISNAVQLYVLMRCEATFLEKTIFEECYVTDWNINPIGPD
ncbi:hypothetical protein ACTXT7_006641 [Hymenolepis weldensis]